MSTQPWKCVLVTGGGGGLGKAFARSLINRGKTVYIAGRTESNLVETTKEIGAAGYFVVDVGDIASLPGFVAKVTKEVPELDCLINNAGIQFIHDFTKGANLDSVNQEITINATGLVNLCGLLVPHLMQKEHACIMNIGSGLGYVPATQFPIYSATKAFVKSFTMALREQLRPANIQVLEVSPPMVNCGNLGRSYIGSGGIVESLKEHIKKRNVAPLTEEEWMAAVEKGWDEGREEIGAGISQLAIGKWREAFGLGKAFARSLINRGKTVYIAGRTESNLVETTKEIGAAGYFVVDVGDIASLPGFVAKVTKEVPELDCLINNAGILFIHDFTKGANLDLVNQEITINTTGLVNLCGLFVPHLMQKEHACIMNIGSGLSYVPATQFPIYSATKAFVKSFTMALREQLRPVNIQVLEISPPMVDSGNLNRSYVGSGGTEEGLKEDIEKGGVAPLTEEEWMAAVEKGWDEGREEIGAGFSQLAIGKWREAFGAMYFQMTGH